jgi:peptidoglycan/LPS O-acetylase OafA/YrhL
MVAGPLGGRWHAIDHIKAAAIVAVVFTHAGRGTGAPEASADFLLTSLWTHFQVPAFLFASGFLYASRSGVDWNGVARRLSRLLLPYLIASFAVIALGRALAPASGIPWPPPVANLSGAAWQLATASALGVYYYVLVIALCIPWIWPLSRSGRAGAWALLLGCIFLTFALDAGLVRRLSVDLDRWLGGGLAFWRARDPFENFQLGYFAAGWLAALELPALVRFRARHPAAAGGGAAAGIAVGWTAFAGWLPIPLGAFGRVIYVVAVLAALALATRSRPAGALLRLLGDASLCIYLYHRLFQLLAEPVTGAWFPVPRILGQVAVGLAGACLLAWTGRRLLGEARARRWLGA